MPRVRVIVVNYNGARYLPRCLSALAGQFFTDFEAVIADNASTDGSADLPLPDERFRWLKLERNLGFAEANNRAAQGTAGEFIATLNPDAFPEPGWLENLVDAARRHPDFAMFGSTQLREENVEILDGTGDRYFAPGMPWRANHGRPLRHLPRAGEMFAPCAAAALYRTSWFTRANGFDAHYFCYCEDVDLAFRIRLLGGRAWQASDAIVRHVGAGVAGSDARFVRYYYARNRIRLFVKNMPNPLFALLLPLHGMLNLALLARALARGEFATASGMTAALRELPETLAARRQVQASRTIALPALMRVLSWSPLAWLGRK